jgi:hypothetical protein
MKLSDIKQTKEFILHVLGQQKEGQHLKCPFHDDKNGSMAIWQGNGVWFWKCHSGCGTGTVIDAAMKRYQCQSPADAVKFIEKECGISIIRDEEYQEPIIDQARALKFVEFAHKNLINNFDLLDKYGSKRKISIDTIKKYNLGFICQNSFKEWRSWLLTGWMIPVYDDRDRLIAVKIHLEKRQIHQPKCLWAPFGIYPSDRPKNGTLTLYPCPEKYDNKSYIIIAPGELKALALIDSGFPAISPTAGENKLPERILKRIVNCKFEKIFINYDNDPTGKEFCENLKKDLSKLGVLAIPYSYSVDIGNLISPSIQIDANDCKKLSTIEINNFQSKWAYHNLITLGRQAKEAFQNDIKEFDANENLKDVKYFFNQLNDEYKEKYKHVKL